MNLHRYTPAVDGEAAIYAAGAEINRRNPETEKEIRAMLPGARAAALAVKSRSESTGWQVGQFTGLNISPFQNWLYEKNREWHFTDGTLCVLWCLEFPETRSDYAKRHKYIASTRRDYNRGQHYAAAPTVPSVAYDHFGRPISETGGTRGRLTARTIPDEPPRSPSALSSPAITQPVSAALPTATAIPRVEDAGGNGIVTDPATTAQRLSVLEAFMTAEVLGPAGFVCRSYGPCRQSHGGLFFEGQLHHIGRHYDLSVCGRALRIVVVGQEYGNGPGGVTLRARYDDVAVRTGLGKRFKTDGIHEVRNPHMRGTTSLLRLLLGRDPGDRHEDEFWEVSGGRIHLFEMFALVNFLLCSAIDADESAGGSKRGRSTLTMQRNCGRHFVRAIEILEPTLVIAQGKGVLQWMGSVMAEERLHSETLRDIRIGRHSALLAALSHPSAKGAYNWADLSRPYLRDVVTSTALQARRLLLG